LGFVKYLFICLKSSWFPDHLQKRDDSGIIEALISEPLADVCPVLLFDMGVIIFVIGTAAGKVDGMISFGKMF
jgi:hypothetical protein